MVPLCIMRNLRLKHMKRYWRCCYAWVQPQVWRKKVSCLFYQYNSGGRNPATQQSFVAPRWKIVLAEICFSSLIKRKTVGTQIKAFNNSFLHKSAQIAIITRGVCSRLLSQNTIRILFPDKNFVGIHYYFWTTRYLVSCFYFFNLYYCCCTWFLFCLLFHVSAHCPCGMNMLVPTSRKKQDFRP